MCKRRGYSDFTWLTEKTATSDGVFIYLVTDFAFLGTLLENDESPTSEKIYVLYDFLRMKKKIKVGQVFSHFDFLYDPLKQNPPMRLLTEEEKRLKVLDTWEAEAKIYTTDVIAKYFNAKPGDVFEILKSDRKPLVLCYRLVII